MKLCEGSRRTLRHDTDYLQVRVVCVSCGLPFPVQVMQSEPECFPMKLDSATAPRAGAQSGSSTEWAIGLLTLLQLRVLPHPSDAWLIRQSSGTRQTTDLASSVCIVDREYSCRWLGFRVNANVTDSVISLLQIMRVLSFLLLPEIVEPT